MPFIFISFWLFSQYLFVLQANYVGKNYDLISGGKNKMQYYDSQGLYLLMQLRYLPSTNIFSHFLWGSAVLVSVDFLGGFETKSPQHLALRPTYVRVPTHNTQSFLRSSQQRLAFTRQDSLAQPRALSFPRSGESIRMCRSDMYVNKAGISGSEERKNSRSEDSKMLPLHHYRHLKPRPMSVHVTTRFD